MLQRVHGNVHIYNMHSRINVSALRPDFARYSQIPPSANCTLTGTRNLVLSDSDFKSLSSSHAEDMMMRTVLFYIDMKKCSSVNLQAARLSVSPLNPHPALSLKNVSGIMCFSRENVVGGLLEIPNKDFKRELVTAEMTILMDNTETDVAVSKLHTIDNNYDGYLDVILFRDLTYIKNDKAIL